MMGKRIPVIERVGTYMQDCFVHTVWKRLWEDCWRCWAECYCGEIFSCQLSNLRSGHTTSCGCYRREFASSHGSAISMTHNQTGTSEYKAWISMKSRCCNSSHPAFPSYGGRELYGDGSPNILIEDPLWRTSFAAFYHDMGPKPHPSFSLERLDNERGYFQRNCVWSDKPSQDANRRSTPGYE